MLGLWRADVDRRAWPEGTPQLRSRRDRSTSTPLARTVLAGSSLPKGLSEATDQQLAHVGRYHLIHDRLQLSISHEPTGPAQFLAPGIRRWFRQRLQRLTAGQPRRDLVIQGCIAAVAVGPQHHIGGRAQKQHASQHYGDDGLGGLGHDYSVSLG